MGNETINLIALNALAVWLIQLFKLSKAMPWITNESSKVNKAVSSLIAALMAGGMTLAVSNTGSGGTGHLAIDYAGFTLANALAFFYHWIAYYATQKGMFKLLVSQSQSTNGGAK